MSNRSTITLVSLMALILIISLTAGAAWLSFSTDSSFATTIQPRRPSAKVLVEVLPASAAGYGPPQVVDYVEFVKSHQVLAPVAEKYAGALPGSSTWEAVDAIRSSLRVRELSKGLIEIDSSLTPLPLGDVILDAVLTEIPDSLDDALWPGQPNILLEQSQLREKLEAATKRLQRLEAEFRKLQETTPLVMVNDGGPAKLPQVIVDKKSELRLAKEDYESVVTELATCTLKTNGGLQCHVIERTHVANISDRETEEYNELRETCDDLPPVGSK